MAEDDDAGRGPSLSGYVKLDHREHVLRRPGMYIGSVEPEPCGAWVLASPASDAGVGPRMEWRAELRYVPGLFKIFDEILVNAVDHATRTRAPGYAGQPVRRIDVRLDAGTGVLEVSNDGDGIPVERHPEHGVWVPELIFGHLLTSTNYDDERDAQRTVGGQNGIGAKACNIFSRWFEVETVDARRRLVYRQRFEDNMARALEPEVLPCPKGRAQPRTTVRFLPDYARLGSSELCDDMRALMARRAYDATAVTDPGVAVTLDGEPVPAKSFERYVDMYLGARGADAGADRAYERVADGWEVAAGLSDGDGLRHVSFVNGVATLRGGKHVDHVVGQLCRRLCELLAARRKLPPGALKPQYVRDNLFVFVRATVPCPAFDSQSKETLTTPAAKWGLRVELSDRFVDRVARLEGLADRVVGLSSAASARTLKSSDGAKRATLHGLPKLDDAEWAGTARSQQCTLILTEGDSAKASAVAGLAVVGRQRYGVFPLRGKIMNVRDAPLERVAANGEIAALKKILGLQAGRDYASTADLRYGRVMLMTDQDTDGSHIRGLVMNLFAHQWPSLLRIDGFLCAMLTPIVKAAPRGRQADVKEMKEFFNLSDFRAWHAGLAPSEAAAWRTKYYKGLGTSTSEEAREWFRRMRIAVYVWRGDASSDALGLGFDKKRADDRKAWLQAYDSSRTLDYGSCDVSYDDFVHRDLIHYSSYDLQRSIPSALDGLKVSQRKALFGCFKRNLREEVRVAQLAAYVSEHAAHHHGEASMQGTIIGMAQDFVGSNNVNLLQPAGQFGTRLLGGGDAASPRYIHTHLAPIARYLFPAADDAVLEYLEDDGARVEPRHYLPVLPMLLVNGAIGIGTGYSTSVPCHDPRALLDQLLTLLDAVDSAEDPVDPDLTDADEAERRRWAKAVRELSLPELCPWYRGFRGAFATSRGRLCSRGVVERAGPTRARVTELPLGYWTEDFKAAAEALLEREPKDLRAVSNDSTNDRVCFTLTFASAPVADAWLAPRGSDSSALPESRLEAELKLVSPKFLGTTNMHAFNARGQIQRYDGTAHVVKDFALARLAGYAARKRHLLARLDAEAHVLLQKVRFVGLVACGELLLQRCSTGPELDAELEARGLARIDGSFRALTDMPLSALTVDRKRALEAELAARQAELAELGPKTPAQLWRADLLALRPRLHEYLDSDSDSDSHSKLGM